MSESHGAVGQEPESQGSESPGSESRAPTMIGVDEMLCFAVYSTNFAFNRLYGELLEELQLTYPQYLTLSLLWARDNQSVGALAQQLFLKTSTVTPLIDRLEAMGLVERHPDPKDRRAVRIALTHRGEGLRPKGACVPEEVLRATGLSVAEAEDLCAKLVKLRDALAARTG